MKKITFFIIILAAIIVLAATDYLINKPVIELSGSPEPESSQGVAEELNLIESLPGKFDYTIKKRDRTKQIFEKFDLTAVDGIKIYRNLLTKDEAEPIVIYEIQVPAKGNLTYLSIKLKLIEQLKETENINETNEYGNNSLYYNSPDNTNNGFLLVRMENDIFGFQYNKQGESFNTVKDIIGELMLLQKISPTTLINN